MTSREKEQVFVSMIKEHERLIYKVCALYSNAGVMELNDLYQESVCALWDAFDSFKGECKLSTWIFSVVRFTMVNLGRKKRVQAVALDDDVEYSASASPLESKLEEVREVMRFLPPDDRDLLLMKMEGYELTEISKAMNISYGNAATRLTRAKDKLKRLYDCI